jgi:hypothetical protein
LFYARRVPGPVEAPQLNTPRIQGVA